MSVPSLTFRTRRIAAYTVMAIIVIALASELLWTWGLHRMASPGLIVSLPAFVPIPFIILGSVARDEAWSGLDMPPMPSDSPRIALFVASISAVLTIAVGAYLWSRAVR